MRTGLLAMILAIGGFGFIGSRAIAQTPAGDSGLVEDDPGAQTDKGADEQPADGKTPGAAEKAKDAAGKDGDSVNKPQFPWIMLVLVGGFVLLYVWMSRGKKKEQQRRKEMLEALKKGDKITTIGGIVGTVMNVRDDEVTIKVDESSNTRMIFARWAVRGVGEAGKAEKPEQADYKT